MGLNGASAATNANPTQQLELLACLADAATPREVAAVIVRLARAEPTCRAATVLWGLDGLKSGGSEPQAPLDDADLAFARYAAMQGLPMFSADGRRAAIPLFRTHPAILLAAFDSLSDSQHFVDGMSAQLTVAGRHLERVLELAELRTSLQRLERSERLQRALFAISDLAGSDRDMPEVLRSIHAIVGTLMYAENFFIVLHDAERDTLQFLYYVDALDPLPPGDNLEIPMHTLERSLTWYLLRDGKPLMGNTPQLRTQVSGPLAIIGPEGYDWLGVPMLRDGIAHGAIVVQSYQESIGYSADDRTLLEFVAEHILTALERKQGKEDLEQRVRARTTELADANAVLQLEIVERQRAERLQKALFEIAQLATADISQSAFYHRVHTVVAGLINAQNFFVGLLSANKTSLQFPYYADAAERGQPSRPLGRGLSEYVIRHCKPLRGMTDDIYALAAQGEIELRTAGTPAVCWLGVPLFAGEEVIGLIVVQSYDPDVVYGHADQELLSFVASQVANSLQRRRSAETLQQAYALLERRVQERTRDLTDTLNQLRDTQAELVRQEKLASLGGLVAGIAHEINTPLGICVTATSHVQGEVLHWRKAHAAGTFDARMIESMFDELDMTVQILENNTRRGAEMVRSFKQIAVDQSSGLRRSFDLAEYLDEIALSLKPRLKSAHCSVQVDCPPGIVMNSFPGALSQVMTNLIMNALLHAFEGREGGLIQVHGEADGDDVVLKIVDDGIGMTEADLKRFFDPFFTTKRGSGGTGLGAHIVFNQVTSVLGGTIRVTSAPGEGLLVQMRLPRTQAATATAV
jgi:signal transduction histidine kinase